MKSLNTLARLVIAAAAASVTFVLFTTVVSLAEPQRSELIAQAEAKRVARAPAPAPAPVTLAQAD